MRLPSVSSFSRTPSAASCEKRSQQKGTSRGSPPPKATYGIPKTASEPAILSASSRLSSSRHPRSGPDSSQHAMQRDLQRLVSCQATNKGARYSSTELPDIADVRLPVGCNGGIGE